MTGATPRVASASLTPTLPKRQRLRRRLRSLRLRMPQLQQRTRIVRSSSQTMSSCPITTNFVAFDEQQEVAVNFPPAFALRPFRCLTQPRADDLGPAPGMPHRPQSSSASRFTAGASGFFNFSQSGERPRSCRSEELFVMPTVARQARERIERGEGSREGGTGTGNGNREAMCGAA